MARGPVGGVRHGGRSFVEADVVGAGRRSAIIAAALLAVLIAVWAGIVPFVGPLFGYSVDHRPAWTWNAPHAVLNLLPGGVATFSGLLVLSTASAWRYARGWSRLRRIGVIYVGALLLVVCGVWLVLGPDVWSATQRPVAGYYDLTSPLRLFTQSLGYRYGPGLLLTALGGVTLGLSFLGRQRHGPDLVGTPTSEGLPARATTEQAEALPAHSEASDL